MSHSNNEKKMKCRKLFLTLVLIALVFPSVFIPSANASTSLVIDDPKEDFVVIEGEMDKQRSFLDIEKVEIWEGTSEFGSPILTIKVYFYGNLPSSGELGRDPLNEDYWYIWGVIVFPEGNKDLVVKEYIEMLSGETWYDILQYTVKPSGEKYGYAIEGRGSNWLLFEVLLDHWDPLPRIVNIAILTQLDYYNLKTLKEIWYTDLTPQGGLIGFEPENWLTYEIDTVPPVISSVKISPSIPGAGESVTVSATIRDEDSELSEVSEVALYYQVDGGSWKSKIMEKEDDTWSATIPGQEGGSEIRYYIEAVDNFDNSISSSFYSYVLKEVGLLERIITGLVLVGMIAVAIFFFIRKVA